jgi:cytochrome P450
MRKKVEEAMSQLSLPPSPMGMDAQKIYQSDPLGTLQTLASFGDVVSFRLGGKPLVLVNHPELVKEVLVNQAKCFGHAKGLHRMRFDLGEGLLTSAGADYQAHRRMSQRAFQSRKIADYEKEVHRIVQETVASLSDPQNVNLSRLMMEMTLTILGETLFNFSMKAHTALIIDAMAQLVDMNFNDDASGGPPDVAQARLDLDTAIHSLLDERGQQSPRRNDLFDELNEFFKEKPARQSRMRDSVLTMILAGHETTASVLAWTWSCLQEAPHVLRKLQNECRTKPVSELIDDSSLSFTQAVLSESMRLYPPVWLMGRRALSDTALRGFLIPQETTVVMSQYLIQRDERFFESPNAFEPQRWLRKDNVQRFTYFPFGGGHRKCIGADLAWMEAAIILVHTIKELDITFTSEPVTGPWVGITMRPREEIQAMIARPIESPKRAFAANVWEAISELKNVTPKGLWNDAGFQNSRSLLTQLGPEFMMHPFAFEHDLTVQPHEAGASLTMGFPIESLWEHNDNPQGLWPLFSDACGGNSDNVLEAVRSFKPSKESLEAMPRRLFCAVEKCDNDNFAVTGLVSTFRRPPIIESSFAYLNRAYSELAPDAFAFSQNDFECLTRLCGKHALEHIGVPVSAGAHAFKAYPSGTLASLLNDLPKPVHAQFFGGYLEELRRLVDLLAEHQTNLVLDIKDSRLQRVGIELKLRHQKKLKSTEEIKTIFNSGFVTQTLSQELVTELQEFVTPQKSKVEGAMALALNHLKVSFRPGQNLQWKAYWIYL